MCKMFYTWSSNLARAISKPFMNFKGFFKWKSAIKEAYRIIEWHNCKENSFSIMTFWKGASFSLRTTYLDVGVVWCFGIVEFLYVSQVVGELWGEAFANRARR